MKRSQGFPQISPRAFQHPDDEAASDAVRQVPLFPQILQFVSKYGERLLELEYMTSCVQLGPDQCRSLYSKYVQAAKMLDVHPLPDLFIKSGPTNAYAIGINRPKVVICSGLLEVLNEDEVLAVLGHELGHVKCRHMLHKTLAQLLADGLLQSVSRMMPMVGPAAVFALSAALFHWSRRAELSCDRAALLVTQDAPTVARALGKLGGWSHALPGQIDLDSLLNQSKRYDILDDEVDGGLFKLLHGASAWRRSHPFVISRVGRITTWAESDQYAEILAGNYAREECPTAGATQRACTECGTRLERLQSFCMNCGAPAPTRADSAASCEACAAWIEPGARFCGECGAQAVGGVSTPASPQACEPAP